MWKQNSPQRFWSCFYLLFSDEVMDKVRRGTYALLLVPSFSLLQSATLPKPQALLPFCSPQWSFCTKQPLWDRTGRVNEEGVSYSPSVHVPGASPGTVPGVWWILSNVCLSCKWENPFPAIQLLSVLFNFFFRLGLTNFSRVASLKLLYSKDSSISAFQLVVTTGMCYQIWPDMASF